MCVEHNQDRDKVLQHSKDGQVLNLVNIDTDLTDAILIQLVAIED